MTAFMSWKAEVPSQMRSAPVTPRSRLNRLFDRFVRDESGSYAIVVALLLPVLVGTAGLGTEVAWWFYKQKNMLSAADSAAVSAATAGTNLVTEAGAITAFYGYTNGTNNVTVTVNQPPTTGSFTSNSQAVEVIISQPQPRLLSALFGSGTVPVTARAVALPNVGTGCVLALDPTANSAVNVSGSNNLNLINCNLYSNSSGSPSLNVSGTARVSANLVGAVGTISGASNITAPNGIRSGIRPTADPYATVSPPTTPTPCDPSNQKINSSGKVNSISPGVCYSGLVSVQSGYTLDLTPGIYYFYGSGGGLSVQGNATVTCSSCTGTAGVTLVFTGSASNGWATANIGSNAIVNLTAPASGPTAGIVMYGDRSMTTGTTFSLQGGGSQNFGGAIYLPKANLQFSGGNGTTSSCTQVIADTIALTGSSNLQVNCAALGGSTIGTTTAQLVE
ncbi:pilus assembly protein TadG-related protein [Bradyrhizobium sp. ISRA443]|uniref:pilus assembly protein TadG-related protein n=1 Tax=unclassified Bradyrhizobium TaxID=2631580 RepID=UPI00247A742A|nr:MULTISPECIES: pilus assembly protein TadG-related protein [unclassified Bradyrhizobium]WGS00645.1 pilus assembly protein TadG-related protein [Bradyrhizobium sp. ISRA436]WGS07533.1 pilus assembly protein TadG-related protein [Bradyrhizobium sp. ISRA437]WGS14420.1 pilus assembly protein TadG-related protein [Bradyrhizobium sp. ISRA443]